MLNEPVFSIEKKEIAFLIDPDKFEKNALQYLKLRVEKFQPAYFFVGGSFLSKENLERTILLLKKHFSLPVIIFPGDHTQISPKADALLFLTLLSGRNPEYLAGQQVKAAPFIQKTGIHTIPVAYLLVDGDKITTVQYITQTLPLPSDKPDLIVATALAGQYMGMKAVYLEAGSGAQTALSPEIVRCVRKNIHLPIIVGGGIRASKQIEAIFEAGANVVVLGTVIEEAL